MVPDRAPSIQQRTDETVARHFGPGHTILVAEMHPLLSLNRRVAVVSGGSRGIGKSTAELLAIHGADVVVTGRTEATLVPVAEVIQHMGRRAEILVGDSADPETAVALGKLMKERFGGQTDIMVNNAAAPNAPDPKDKQKGFGDKSFDKYGPNSWGELEAGVQANLLGPVRMTTAVYRNIQAAGPKGRIVTIGSISAEGVKGQSLYILSKGGLATITKGWAAELIDTEGTANVIAPGPVETVVWKRAIDAYKKTAERFGNDPKADPLKPVKDRMISGRFSTPEEIARTALYLASDMGSQTTRQILVVDGGVTILSLG